MKDITIEFKVSNDFDLNALCEKIDALVDWAKAVNYSAIVVSDEPPPARILSSSSRRRRRVKEKR